MSSEYDLLVVARSTPIHQIGGMEVVSWTLATRLARDGVRIKMLTTSIPGRSSCFELDGIEVNTIPDTTPGRYSRTWWRAVGPCAEALGRPRAILSISVAAAGFRAVCRAWRGVPLVAQIHGTPSGDLRARLGSRNVVEYLKLPRSILDIAQLAPKFRVFDHLILVGEMVEQQIRRWPMSLVVGKTPFQTIPNGVDEDAFRMNPQTRESIRQSLAIHARRHVLTFAARLHPQKGAHLAIGILKRGLDLGLPLDLVIIGDGRDRARLEAMARGLSVVERTHFVGRVHHSDVPNYLSAGDQFLFPTLGPEGLPLSVLEALASGLPCVVAERVRGAFSAKLPITFADPGNPEQWIAAIRKQMGSVRKERSLLTADYRLNTAVARYMSVLGLGGVG